MKRHFLSLLCLQTTGNRERETYNPFVFSRSLVVAIFLSLFPHTYCPELILPSPHPPLIPFPTNRPLLSPVLHAVRKFMTHFLLYISICLYPTAFELKEERERETACRNSFLFAKHWRLTNSQGKKQWVQWMLVETGMAFWCKNLSFAFYHSDSRHSVFLQLSFLFLIYLLLRLDSFCRRQKEEGNEAVEGERGWFSLSRLSCFSPSSLCVCKLIQNRGVYTHRRSTLCLFSPCYGIRSSSLLLFPLFSSHAHIVLSNGSELGILVPLSVPETQSTPSFAWYSTVLYCTVLFSRTSEI